MVPQRDRETGSERGRGNVYPLAARKHGAYSDGEIGALAGFYLRELLEELPAASERVLLIQARRLARLDLLARFEDEHGVLRNRRRGEPFAATLLAEKISSAYVRTHTDLEAQHREASKVDPQAALDAHLAEIAEVSES